ncbi:MAG: UDP-glucose 4-epimerase GalE, partial [Bdellovibrionales bacterium]|nr:UDP-glucose 4-epimerase GalE [Bdellovibrionales bacterium]
MAHVLVVGGAGYIGSAMVALLMDDGHQVTILDNLSTGHRELVLSDSFFLGQCGSRLTLNQIFEKSKIDCVMHFAAKSIVPESIQFPDLYYENNVLQTTVLLNAMLDHGVNNLVFSSTCATYGEVQTPSISEEQPQQPVNPYGQTKLEAELLMRKLAASRGLRTVSLRYFNACGAEAKLRAGEWHEPETHLIPRLLQAALKNETAQVYGNDYPTPDGTCVRDYVHVSDLARAHALAMGWLLSGNP